MEFSQTAPFAFSRVAVLLQWVPRATCRWHCPTCCWACRSLWEEPCHCVACKAHARPTLCLWAYTLGMRMPSHPTSVSAVTCTSVLCWDHSLCLSVCNFGHVSDHVWSISLEPLNHFLPNLWCIIMRRCVLQKNWFFIFNVEVTARAYIIKIWQFLLYLLKCWSAIKLGLRVQHHKLECPVEELDYCIQGQGHSKGSNCWWMFVGWYLFNYNPFYYQTWYGYAAS